MGAVPSARLADLPDEVPVLIAGGGPSGLFLALDLAQRGIRSLVIEPRTSIDQDRPRAKTTNARTMTHLRRIGLAEALRKAAPLPVEFAQDVIFCSSLTGREIRRFPQAFQLETGRYEPQPECGQQVPQPVLESLLRRSVEDSAHATLLTGLRVESHATSAMGQEVTVVDQAGTVPDRSQQFSGSGRRRFIHRSPWLGNPSRGRVSNPVQHQHPVPLRRPR